MAKRLAKVKLRNYKNGSTIELGIYDMADFKIEEPGYIRSVHNTFGTIPITSLDFEFVENE